MNFKHPSLLFPSVTPLIDDTRYPGIPERHEVAEGIIEIECQLESLADTRAAAYKFIRDLDVRERSLRLDISHRAAYIAPVRRLATELLLEIFDHVAWTVESWDPLVSDDRSMQFYSLDLFACQNRLIPQLMISHVCTKWRDLAISQRRYWTVFPLFGTCNKRMMEMAAIWHRRTLFSTPPIAYHPTTVIVPRSLFGGSAELIKPIVESIIRQYSRGLGTLYLNGRFVGKGLASPKHDYPMLRRVVIHRTPLKDDIPIGTHINHLSAIRARDALSLGVTSKNLRYLKIDQPCSLMEIKLLIPSLHNLRELHISFSIDDHAIDHHDEYPIDTDFNLPHLHTLYVTAEGSDMHLRMFESFFNHTRFPCLRHLDIIGHGWAEKDFVAIANVLAKSLSPLTYLAIRQFIQGHLLEGILIACPSLRTFHVVTGPDFVRLPSFVWPRKTVLHARLALFQTDPLSVDWPTFISDINSIEVEHIYLTVISQREEKVHYEQSKCQCPILDETLITLDWDIIDDYYSNVDYWSSDSM